MATNKQSSIDKESSVTKNSKLSRLRIFTWPFFIAFGMIAAVFFWIYAQKIVPKNKVDNSDKTVSLQRISLPITISANGIVQSERLVNISPESPGVLDSLLVDEGSLVTEGDVIARMDDSNLKGQLTEARGRLAAAQANLQKLLAGTRKEEIQQAQARLIEAQALVSQTDSNLRQDESLWADGAISTRAVNDARTAYNQALAQQSEAQAALEQAQNGSRVEDIAQARAEVIQAQGALENVQALVEDTIIRTPFSGVVMEKFTEPGAFISPTSRLGSAVSSAIVTIAGENEIIANVAEANISQITLGQTVIIEADAYPGQTFPGEVTRIAPQAILVQNVTNFEVNIAILEDSEKLLRPGMNVEVSFQVGELSNALVVPTVAIVREEAGTGVYVETEEGEPEFTPIETGVTLEGQTEVSAGLTGNEKIFISFPEGVKPESVIPGL